ncbi:MAG: bifunctional adenosylcobinamide kinase/adenosylcobinamide-phosphate guanylyltransferase [Eubacteriales bacterium]|nr:bifunctional adenosylcobinamide kinase/adenosylcobinamide-phosphate guanylyltransferase [Eubacteriales bacterium]
MILVYGGAYQGKLDFARSLLKDNYVELPDLAQWEDVVATGEAALLGLGMDLGLLVADIEDWLERNYRLSNADWDESLTLLTESMPEPAVIVIEDQGQGVVPLDAELRAKREANGRALQYFSSQATEVYRIMAGQALQLKGGN